MQPHRILTQSRRALLVGACVALAVSARSAAAAEKSFALASRVMPTAEEFATGYRANVSFINERPPFSVSIPEPLQGHWYFVVSEEPSTPFYIIKPTTAELSLPFVSSTVQSMSLRAVSFKPDDVFKIIAEDGEAWQRRRMPDLAVVNPGRLFKVNGLPAYERVVESASQGLAAHVVYILCDDHLIELELNSRRAEFPDDDREFLKMVQTITYVTR